MRSLAPLLLPLLISACGNGATPNNVQAPDVLDAAPSEFYFMARRVAFRPLRRPDSQSAASPPTPPPYPSPDWRVRSDNASYALGKVTTVTATTGPDLVATTGAEPLQGGPSLNGHPSVIFGTAGTRLEAAGTVVSGSSNSDTFSVIAWCDNDVGVGDREYFLYWHNNTGSAADHLVYPQQANIVGFDQYGVFAGSAWRGLTAAPSARPCVLTYRRAAGTTTVWRNGILLGTDVGAAAVHSYTYANVGASYGAIPVTQWIKCAWFGLDFWGGEALTDGQILAHATEQMDAYGITGTEYYPSDNAASLTMWLDSRGKHDVASGQWTGTATLSQWDDQSGLNHFMAQGTPGQYPIEGTRINGRPTLLLGTASWLGGSTLQGTLTAASGAAYSVMTVIRPAAIVSTQATGVDARDCVMGDVGDYWAVNLFLNATVPTVGVYHYGGATYAISDIGIAIGTPVLVHVWWDGADLKLRVGDRTAVTLPAANLGPATALRLGFGQAGAAKFQGDMGEVIFRNAANTTHMNADRAYMGRVYGVAY